MTAKDNIEFNIKIDGTKLGQAANFKYLDSIVNEGGKLNEEINQRVAAAGKLFNCMKKYFLGNKETQNKLKWLLVLKKI